MMTYRELLSRLTDLHLLMHKSSPNEHSGCMSSYDRASRFDESTGTYINWDANDDGSGRIRTLPDGSIVAFEQEGPGVIWRIWSALPQQGHMRVYIDDNALPAVDTPFMDWFEKQPGDIPPLNLSELSMRLSRGRNSFIPIPFQKRCRVELAPEWGAYYHFTYTLFDRGTVMPSYQERFNRDGMMALAETDRLLYERGEAIRPNERLCEASVAPGGTVQMLALTGAGLIEELALDSTGADISRLLIRMYWDGRERPAVEAPLGEFFGGAPGYAHYRCLPMSMERAQFTCRFPMPYSEGCRIEVVNLSGTAQTVRMHIAVDTSFVPDSDTLRFHAKFHRGYFGPVDAARFAPGAERWPDWPLLLVHGAYGRFIGVHLHVYDTWHPPKEEAASWWYGAWDRKTVDWWWGEGDEKFFVDGECFPSTFGTGSEDYIGYAWAAEPPFARFDSPYACLNAMPIDGNGHTAVSRFHIADSIPISSSFEGFIEKYKGDVWDGHNICLYGAVPYWYQQAGTDDTYPNVKVDDLMFTDEQIPWHTQSNSCKNSVEPSLHESVLRNHSTK